ncbi:protein phosphatase 2C domain-containing protein [Aquiflexum gelatinilyticum]|uniref:protein phosphatase 2C domain-containing protein n=1 Tax=Aquiflexum gelatinilyticum TaxID=2961943 RepID=UPI00216A186D|nr:protein phosphatase 2C domain-containing protein [Aquiflexum gelatinilyticum]MCS4432846.1 protein phosphatase 2C domain-containing protein [Aquiflexum gelatinilyticum]
MKLPTTVIKASIRGNKDEEIPNQDFIQLMEDDDILIATISDGLGSSKHSLEGAKLACKTVIEEMMDFQLTSELQLLNEQIKTRWESEINKLSKSIKDYRTTNSFVAVSKKDKKIIVGQLGDVLVSLRIDGLFRYLQSASKDFSNETDCLGSGRNENFNLALYEFGHSFDFLIATDGIGDELEIGKIESLHNYFKSKFKQIDSSIRNDVLKQDIENFISEKNNDDKSLVFIWTNNI